MTTFRFDLDEAHGRDLEAAAAARRMTVQEYVRYRLFNEQTIFTVDEVVQRITRNAGAYDGKEFTVPDVYSIEEWAQISRGPAGVLGRNFYNHITEHPELGIRFVPGRTINRRAVYTYHSSACSQ